MATANEQEQLRAYLLAGMFTLSLCLAVGWTYFSTLWRRLILENKLIPDSAEYTGEKFSHLLPSSIGIRPVVGYLISTPDMLWWAMVIPTPVEGVVELLYMLEFFTRLMSIGVFSLATDILLGSGWLGTTCLDEWQTGILGVAAGLTIFLSGGGRYPVDYLTGRKSALRKKTGWLIWLTSRELPLKAKRFVNISVVGAIVISILTLYTNQEFHNGVWGLLHNKSIKPKIEISDAQIEDNSLSFSVYRVEGADVYGSFLIGISLKDANGHVVLEEKGEELTDFPIGNIDNKYIARVASGEHSPVIPLGSKTTLTVNDPAMGTLPRGKYELVLTDISGITWKKEIVH